jgi:hypothetical protein
MAAAYDISWIREKLNLVPVTRRAPHSSAGQKQAAMRLRCWRTRLPFLLSGFLRPLKACAHVASPLSQSPLPVSGHTLAPRGRLVKGEECEDTSNLFSFTFDDLFASFADCAQWREFRHVHTTGQICRRRPLPPRGCPFQGRVFRHILKGRIKTMI